MKLSSQGINAKSLHGDLSQAQRERVTSDFRHKRISVLVATDVAARGLHIEDISHVYNYEIPRDVESYTHRVGRTARAGKKGEAISLVASHDEQKFFKQILFTYRGSITLKRLDDVRLTPLETKESQHPSQDRKSGDHRHDRKSGHQQRDRKSGHHKHEKKSGYQQHEKKSGYQQHEKKSGQQHEKKSSHDQTEKKSPNHTPDSERPRKKKGAWKKKWQDLMNR